jgi:outer membrane protein assembly factor BamB
LYAVDPEGSVKWHFDAGGSVVSSPIIDNEGVVYFTAGTAVYAVNPDGRLKWRYAPQPRIPLTTSPVIAADGTLYLGGDFAVLALHPDGTLKSNLRDYTPTSSLTIAQDGTIYFACGYSWLCAIEDVGSPLMRSAWPKQFHDLANTSNPLHGEN